MQRTACGKPLPQMACLLGILAVLAAAPLAAQSFFIRGDANASGVVDLSDAIHIFGHLFLGDPAILACQDAADVDNKGGLNVTDGIYLLDYLFDGGAAPPKPFPGCGPDAVASDGLSCKSHPPCAPPPCAISVNKKVDVGGYALFTHSAGRSCPPTIVLDAGLDSNALGSWDPIFSALAQTSLVVGYDRAGYRTSDPAPSPRDAVQEMTELHTLLENAGFDPPYVLVGHSMGGYNIRVFANKYPDEVGGMVFIDGSHEDWFNAWLQDYPDSYAQWLAQTDASCASTPADTWCREWDSFKVERLIAPGPIPDVPIAVLTATKDFCLDASWSQAECDALRTAWIDAHESLARSVSDGVHIVDPTSSHYIHWDNPKLVLQQVRDIVEKARKQ